MSFTELVVIIVKQIPEGRVTTYGEIAKAAGNPRASRQVVRVLNAKSNKEGLPWHRIVNKAGIIALSGQGAALQKALLEEEGVHVDEAGRIDLRQYGYEIKHQED